MVIYITADEAAEYLDVDVAVVRKWAERGWIGVSGTADLYSLDDVYKVGEIRFGPQYHVGDDVLTRESDEQD